MRRNHLFQGKFRLDIRENLFTKRLVRHWRKLLRYMVGSPSLEVLKIYPDVSLGDIVYWWRWQWYFSGRTRWSVILGIFSSCNNFMLLCLIEHISRNVGCSLAFRESCEYSISTSWLSSLIGFQKLIHKIPNTKSFMAAMSSITS